MPTRIGIHVHVESLANNKVAGNRAWYVRVRRYRNAAVPLSVKRAAHRHGVGHRGESPRPLKFGRRYSVQCKISGDGTYCMSLVPDINNALAQTIAAVP